MPDRAATSGGSPAPGTARQPKPAMQSSPPPTPAPAPPPEGERSSEEEEGAPGVGAQPPQEGAGGVGPGVTVEDGRAAGEGGVTPGAGAVTGGVTTENCEKRKQRGDGRHHGSAHRYERSGRDCKEWPPWGRGVQPMPIPPSKRGRPPYRPTLHNTEQNSLPQLRGSTFRFLLSPDS